jgi:hypothetical protein
MSEHDTAGPDAIPVPLCKIIALPTDFTLIKSIFQHLTVLLHPNQLFVFGVLTYREVDRKG